MPKFLYYIPITTFLYAYGGGSPPEDYLIESLQEQHSQLTGTPDKEIIPVSCESFPEQCI